MSHLFHDDTCLAAPNPEKNNDFILEAALRDLRPRISRTLKMSGANTFAQLHTVLQIVFGWKDYHLHLFTIGDMQLSDLNVYEIEVDEIIQEERDVRLHQLLKRGTRFLYQYDFGDNWHVDLDVRETVPADGRTRPTCLDGERAGPHEDCGGISGYHALVEALSDQKHPEHDEMRMWAGRSYDPAHFALDTVNRALARRFPSPRPKTDRVPSPYDPSSGPPRLEHYRLERMTLRQKMIVALEEGPRSFDELLERLAHAGVALPHGVESLRRAWKHQPPIRERLDGRLDLDRDHAEYAFSKIWMDAAAPKQPKPEKPAPAQADVSRRLTLDELRGGNSTWPSGWTLRRKLLMLADTFGDLCTEKELRDGLVSLRQSVPQKINGASWSDAFFREPDGVFRLDRSHADVINARRDFRKWRMEAAERERMLASIASRTEDRQREREKERVAFEASRRVFIRVYRHYSRVTFGCLLWLPDMRLQLFDSAAALRETLRETDWIFGIDPRRDFEALELEPEHQRFVDLTPPFRSVDVNGRREKLSLSSIVAMSVPSRLPLSTNDDCNFLLRSGQREVLCDRLATDVRLLYAFWRYAVEHRGIRRTSSDFDEHYWVDWNVGNEPDGVV